MIANRANDVGLLPTKPLIKNLWSKILNRLVAQAEQADGFARKIKNAKYSGQVNRKDSAFRDNNYNY